MEAREWRTEDKSTWGEGPWQDEPDKVQWVDEVTGLDCLIVRGPSGALCGYVGVPESHPWHGVGYSGCVESCGAEWCAHSPGDRTEVHGGLTFAAACHEGPDPSRGICHIPEPGRPDHVWWFGFDCAHSWDVTPASDARLRVAGREDLVGRDYGQWYKSRRFVENEVRKLAAQLATVESR